MDAKLLQTNLRKQTKTFIKVNLPNKRIYPYYGYDAKWENDIIQAIVDRNSRNSS